MEAIETLASLWIAEHPEYHLELADVEAALRALELETVQNTAPDGGSTTNTFMHLSMHLTLSEQCSIDQPRGIRQAIGLLTARLGDLHAAHHAAMDCLGQMVWEAQRSAKAPDGNAYIDCVQRRATRD
ncbi:MAG: hypothetical protein RLZZ126_708 [Pseudomonadota bacterium]